MVAEWHVSLQETLGMRDRDIEGLNMELRTLKGDMAQDVNRLEAEAAKATARLRYPARSHKRCC